MHVHVSCNKKWLCVACGISRIEKYEQKITHTHTHRLRPIQMCLPKRRRNGMEKKIEVEASSRNRTSEMNSQLAAVTTATATLFFSLSLSLLFYFLYCEECVIGALQPSICWHLLTLCLFVCTLCFIRFRIQFLMHKPIKHFLFSFFDNGICSKKHKNSLSINGALA